jgi:uncharacterized RDD family membrane protein YckC
LNYRHREIDIDPRLGSSKNAADLKSMKQVFNTSVGKIEVSVDHSTRTLSVYRFDDAHQVVAGAIESWDHVDLLDVFSRHVGLPWSEASRVVREVREHNHALESLAARVGRARRERDEGRPLETAGISLRFVAVLLDTIIVFVPMFVVVGLLTGGGYSEHAEGYSNVGIDVGGGAFLLLLGLGIGYYVACEALTGMTVGKGMVGIRVVGEEGERVTFGAAVLRNLARLVDAFFFYLVAFVFAMQSPLRQRLGDRLAHTVVVRN